MNFKYRSWSFFSQSSFSCVLSIWIFMQLPQFGKLPSGERLERIKKSPHYKEGQFQNIHFTPNLVEGFSVFTVMRHPVKTRSHPCVMLQRRTDKPFVHENSTWSGFHIFFKIVSFVLIIEIDCHN